MEAVFLKVLNMGIVASYLILAVMLLRLMIKRAPKWISCILWALVGVRLVCPFSVESVLSLIPSAEPIGKDIVYSNTPHIEAGIPFIDHSFNPMIRRAFTPDAAASVNPLQIWVSLAALIWIVGIVVMAGYGMISYFRLKRKVRAAILLKENVWLCDEIRTPFILGIFCPRIYIPSGMSETQLGHVFAHEQAHLRRRDHWWKPLGFLILSVYWFHPLCYAAYILFCRDIELACDERVIRDLDMEGRKAYSKALLMCSIPRKMEIMCPLAFGEVGVKERIKEVLNYKKPAFWVVAAALVVCIMSALCFMTSPKAKNDKEDEIFVSGTYYALEPDSTNQYPTLSLDLEEHTFSFGYDAFSSYLTVGRITEEGKRITAVTNDGKYTYIFERKDEKTLRFVAEGSDEIRTVLGEQPVKDGTEFILAQLVYAVVREIGDGSMFVEPEEDSMEIRSADRFQVPLQNIAPSPEPEVGDTVLIFYDGNILESFPAQFGEIYHIKVYE